MYFKKSERQVALDIIKAVNKSQDLLNKINQNKQFIYKKRRQKTSL